jgi:hypothetical protein
MEIFVPVVVGLFVAAAGWWIVHSLTAKRDLANKRRDRQLEAMVEVFRELTRLRSLSNVLTVAELAESISKISAGIELFGTKHQVELFRKVSESLNSGRLLGVHDLIDRVRNDIRQSLSLDAIDSTVGEFRFNVPSDNRKA